MDTHHYQGHCVVLNTLLHLVFHAHAGKRMNDYNCCPQFSYLPNDLGGGDTLAVYKADIINIITQINQIEFASWKSSTKEE